MKALFITILIFAGAFLAYDYFGNDPWDRLVFEKSPRPPGARPSPGAAGSSSGADESAPATPPAPSSTPAASHAADDFVVTVPKVPSDEFVPPNIPSVESVTQNWTRIPPQTFPRQVVLKKEVAVQMTVGSSVLRAGATAQAVGAENGVLIVAPVAGSAARGKIAVTDTDFPEQIRANYDKWKAERIEQARLAWVSGKMARQQEAARQTSTTAPVGVSSGGGPARNSDGSYNILLAAISTGHITDVDPKQVTHWAPARLETIDGQPTWVIDVTYNAKTIFGFMEINSHAHVRGNLLVRWIYDSGEPLP